MQFNSFLFFVFFAFTYSIYLCCNHKWQNKILLLASYVFYGAWDYRFLSLILLSTFFNFIAANKIDRSHNKIQRKFWLWTSVVANLGLLGFFKYYNFFVTSFADLLRALGLGDHSFVLHIVLPVGISFYTFQTLSYVIDIYRKEISQTNSFSNFALYVSFFPQLVAGPIERATRLLPQVCLKRKITEPLVKSSCYLFLFGLFEKVVVADNLAAIVDPIYNGNHSDGFSVLLATYAFAFQIFADFDGYSNMAKGLAGLMGFELIVNFRAPYFSENPSDFWNRWHISLSSWLRDYLYIPLGGNRHGLAKTVRNIFLTMLLAGLWHGASWMFVFWGVFHGILLVAYLPLKNKIIRLPSTLRKLLFFHLVCFGWMLFRAQSPVQLYYLINQLFCNFQFNLQVEHLLLLKKVFLYSAIPLAYQYLQYRADKLCPIFDWPIPARSIYYVFLFYLIVIFGFNNAQSFIYFQF